MLNFDYLNDDLAFKQVFMHNEILEDLITSFLNYIGKNNNNRFNNRINTQFLYKS